MLIRKDGIYRNIKDSAISEYTGKGYEKVQGKPEKPKAQEKPKK
nr:MAG TPA: hypothetical protein [Caudoviricetes sp.]